MSSKPPIFIVGAPRSGTTLLAEILGRHSNIFIFNETLFYDFIASKSHLSDSPGAFQSMAKQHLCKRLALRVNKAGEGKQTFGCRVDEHEVGQISQFFAARLEAADHSAAGVLGAFMEAICKVRGKVRWGEKTPNHVFHLRSIASDFPGAKIIFVVRDPRNFLKSYKHSWRQKGGRRSAAKLYHPLVTSILWRRSMKAFRDYVLSAGSVDTEMVTYEELRDKKATTLTRICEYLNEDFQPSMLEIRGTNTSFAAVTVELTTYELAVCEGVCGSAMIEAGYLPLTKVWVRWPAVIISVLTLPWFLARALPVVLKAFNGGLWAYLKARGVVPVK